MFDYLLESRLPPTLLQNTHKWLNFDLEQFFHENMCIRSMQLWILEDIKKTSAIIV